MSLTNKSADGQPSALQLDIQLSHQYLSTHHEEQAFYVLIDISQAADLPLSRLPLNLCLVLDRSTSMRGLRLQQMKQGIQKIIDQLKPEDALSIVVFSDKSKVLLPSKRNINQSRVKSLINTIQTDGATEMLQGLTAGLEQLEFHRTSQTVNHLIFLTDGQTYGDEAQCLEKSQWAGLNQISFTTMGVGADWNETLLDQMATAAGGTSIYIDSPREMVEAFSAIIHTLSSVVARDLTLQVKPTLGVTLKEAFQISPYLSPLDLNTAQTLLGPLAAETGKRLIMEFRIQTQLTQNQDHLMQLTINSDIPHNQYRNWETVNIPARFSKQSSGNTAIPSIIVTALGKLAIFKMQEKALHELQEGEVTLATRRLETMAKRLLNLGETDLAQSALLEAGRLAHTGSLSAEGRKKIRYGTRSLSILPKEINRD